MSATNAMLQLPNCLSQYQRLRSKLLLFIGLFALYLCGVVGFVFVIRWLDSFLELPANPYGMMKGGNTLYKLAIVVVAAPIVEEVAFRLHLRFSKLNFFLSIWGILLFLGVAMAGTPMFSKTTLGIMAASSVVVGGGYQLISKKVLNRIGNLHAQFLWPIIILSSLLFSVMHYYTVDFFAGQNYYLLLMLLPQIVFGVLVSVLRLKAGFGYAVLFHSIHNLLIFLPILLIQ